MAIVLVGDETPSFPEDFARRLRAFDPDLLLWWYKPPHWPRKKPGVWQVQMCVRHVAAEAAWPDGHPKHSHVCDRRYVLQCQDEDGTPKPLGEWIFEKLREMRAYSESFGGETERGLKNFIEHSNRMDAELEAKREAERQDVMRHNAADNRVQLNKLWNLIERHDMRPNR